jgi:hypothetical protein
MDIRSGHKMGAASTWFARRHTESLRDLSKVCNLHVGIHSVPIVDHKCAAVGLWFCVE